MEETKGKQEATKAIHLSGWKLGVVIASLWLGTLLVAIDNTIIGIVVPKISTQFDSLEDVGWYGSSYLLTVTACGPNFGKLFKYFDPKYTYLAAIVGFEVGSVVCAAAPNFSSFIAGRAIAGLLDKRPMFLGIIVSVFGMAMGFGPPLGGAFTDGIGWRWCFWINLPIGGAVIALILLFLTLDGTLNDDRRQTTFSKLKSLDFVGAMLIFGAVCCLLLAVQWGGTKYAWISAPIIGLFVSLGLILIIFIAHQWWQGDKGTIPPRVLRQRPILTRSLFICFSHERWLLR
ncbi:major facilitator superfamily domain-containing protein [Lophiotrema nucula]|uniref:Major facilitator superfamily domain-containing protein n=1 Tax=Lophiotrema nucula TaxID=690887 RepID=A0A6A5Z3F8_9PLEO|nr:major facilitator superfamily domain-containing protein [Lophiotrema nucula]